MTQLNIEVVDWFDPGVGDARDRQTYGSLKITVEANGQTLCLTQVDDRASKSTRDFVRVPVLELANWFIANWWRLRWEDRTQSPSYEWKCSHRFQDIGGGDVWPPIEIFSTIDQIGLSFEARANLHYSTLRFISPNIEINLSGFEFEAAVRRFLDQVQERLLATVPDDHEFCALLAELTAERQDAEKTMLFRMQALAGFDPDENDGDFLNAARRLEERLGPRSALELLSAVKDCVGDLSELPDTVERVFQSSETMELAWSSHIPHFFKTNDEPWILAVTSASEFRKFFGLGLDPIRNAKLEELTGIGSKSEPSRNGLGLTGGLRDDLEKCRIRVAGLPRRSTRRRFDIARIIAAAQVMDLSTERLLPVTRSRNRLQQFERSFAQELLCPWAVIDDRTNQFGLSEDVVLDLAAEYEVSEQTVRTTLVNRRKAPRSFLELVD